MALTIEEAAVGSIGIDEYVEYVDSCVDVFDLDSVAESASYFAALLNDTALLSDAVKRELRSWRAFQRGNAYSGRTFVLGAGRRKPFFVRANVWCPPSRAEEVADWEKNMFAYGVAHDHDFSFMTGGYLGSGCETAIYEYDRSSVRGEIGEAVELRFSENTYLSLGKIMLFRESLDVHVQGFPKEMSVSINLMLPPRGIERQLFFDVSQSRICRPEIGTQDARAFLNELAQLCGDEESQMLARELRTQRR